MAGDFAYVGVIADVGRILERPHSQVLAAVCCAYTEVAALPPEKWSDGFGRRGLFQRVGGTSDVRREVEWFFARVDALGAELDGLSPGQVAQRVMENLAGEDIYVRNEAEAAVLLECAADEARPGR